MMSLMSRRSMIERVMSATACRALLLVEAGSGARRSGSTSASADRAAA